MHDSPLTSLPTEIWDDIITLACTDGGFTGRSLALTCKFLHIESSHIRFHSLSITSLDALKGFLAFVQSRGPDYKPMVHHLFLSFYVKPPSTAYRYSILNSIYGIDSRWDSYVDGANALFTLIAPTLQTLCLIQGYWLDLAPFPCAMPALTELTLVGPNSIITPPSGSTGASELCRLPALRWFHLVSRSAEAREKALTASFISHSPLTHLRLSAILQYDHLPTRDLLASVLGLSVPAARRLRIATLPHVRGVIIHTAMTQSDWLFDDQPWKGSLAALHDLEQASACVIGGPKVAVTLRPTHSGVEYSWAWTVRNDWQSRMEGGEGCWGRLAEGARPESPVSYEDYDFDSFCGGDNV